MKLRTKLLFGYAGFVLALGVLGAWSARTLNEMSAVSGRIIEENYDSVVAAQDMKESLERQDSAALFELLEQHDQASRQLAEHRVRFDAAFEKAAANITEPGEAEVVEAIRRGRDDYYQRYDEFLRAPEKQATQYFDVLQPRFDRVRADCDRLLRLNQEAMRRKADEASAIARRWFFITLALVLVLMLVGVAVEFSLSNAIIGPVRQLTAATTRVAAGDLDAAVPVRSADEIGTLAGGFNRMAERIRELRRSDLSEMTRLQSEFMANASQELRTPLTSVQIGIHLLLEGVAGTLDDRQQEILVVCRDDANRLDRLMRQLLDLSKVEAGAALAPATVPVRPSVLLRDAAESLRLQLEAKGLHLKVDAPPDIPAVLVDRDQMQRVIVNLVSNAGRATPSGGTITLSATRRARDVAFAVADTGTGIPRDVLPRIFEPFVQAGNAAGGGSGLGLTISRRIVEAHGGQLTAESEPGRGSTFTFTVPIGDASQPHSDAKVVDVPTIQ